MTINAQELLAEFEAAYETTMKISQLQTQIKWHKSEIKERLEQFASDTQTQKAYINDAYNKYKELREKGAPDEESDDYQELMSLVDEIYNLKNSDTGQ